LFSQLHLGRVDIGRGHNSQYCEWLEKVDRHYHTHLFNDYASREVIGKQAVSIPGYIYSVAARQLKFHLKGRFLEEEIF